MWSNSSTGRARTPVLGEAAGREGKGERGIVTCELGGDSGAVGLDDMTAWPERADEGGGRQTSRSSGMWKGLSNQVVALQELNVTHRKSLLDNRRRHLLHLGLHLDLSLGRHGRRSPTSPTSLSSSSARHVPRLGRRLVRGDILPKQALREGTTGGSEFSKLASPRRSI